MNEKNLRTWISFLVRYEERPYKKGLNKLAVYYLAGDEYLGDFLPDDPDHLRHIIVAIENNTCPVMEGWETGTGHRADIHGWAD